MAESTSLEVQGRDRAGKGAARATRREGMVPGVIYGDKKDPVMISVDPRYLIAEMSKPGFNTRIFEIAVNGTTHRTMAQDIQMDPVRDMPIHVDFRRIGANTVVTVEIPVHFLNEPDSPGIKRGGVLNVVRHAVEVTGKPDVLPQFLEADLTGLDIGDSIHISAISLPEGVAPTITDRDFTVATVAAPSVMKGADEDEEEEGEEGEEGEEAGGDDAGGEGGEE